MSRCVSSCEVPTNNQSELWSMQWHVALEDWMTTLPVKSTACCRWGVRVACASHKLPILSVRLSYYLLTYLLIRFSYYYYWMTWFAHAYHHHTQCMCFFRESKPLNGCFVRIPGLDDSKDKASTYHINTLLDTTAPSPRLLMVCNWSGWISFSAYWSRRVLKPLDKLSRVVTFLHRPSQ